MEYRKLFADVNRRPSVYGLDGSYRQHVAFITGCDAGNDWGLLVGFPEWLAMKVEAEANVTWSSLVLQVVGLTAASGHPADEESDSKAVEALFALLDDFLSQRAGAKGASSIISRYITNRRGDT